MAHADLGPWQQIAWKAPQRDGALAHAELNFFSSELSPLDAAPSAFVAHVPGKTPLEEALVLLRAGSEVEHALLVEYLYAGWSIADNPIAGTILEIAIQEMCHFITVQNLMLFLGALPSVRRQDQDPAPALDPFPFRLQPFSAAVLEDFLLTEMPDLDQMTSEQKDVMDPIIQRAKQAGKVRHPVGKIYAKLYWLLQENDLPTKDWPALATMGFDRGRHIATFPGAGTEATFQVDPIAERAWKGGDAHGGVFEAIGSRDAALRAVFRIASQGEGAAPADRSHFESFLAIYRDLDPTAPPATNWPTEPFVSAQAANDPEREANRLTSPAAVALSRLLDLRYRIALTSIRASLARDRSKAVELAIRTKYVGWAFNEMLGWIKGLSVNMADVPSKANGSGPSCAPTFGVDGFALPNDAIGLDAVLAELHTAAASAMSEAQMTDIGASLQSLIDDMRTDDQARFPQIS